MLRAFTSLETGFKITPRFWKTHTTEGKMRITDYNIRERYAFLRLSGHKESFSFICPIIYDYMRGYLTKIIEILTRSKNVKVELKKSISKNDNYDEFKMTW